MNAHIRRLLNSIVEPCPLELRLVDKFSDTDTPPITSFESVVGSVMSCCRRVVYELEHLCLAERKMSVLTRRGRDATELIGEGLPM